MQILKQPQLIYNEILVQSNLKKYQLSSLSSPFSPLPSPLLSALCYSFRIHTSNPEGFMFRKTVEDHTKDDNTKDGQEGAEEHIDAV